jgi:hypothetical protein
MSVEYPRHVHKYGGEYLIVRSESEHEEALLSGWEDSPPQTPPPELEEILADEPALSVDETPTVAITPKRKPGRPKKATE